MRRLAYSLAVAGLCTCSFLMAGCSHDEGATTRTDHAIREETTDLPKAEAKTATAVKEELEASQSSTSDEAAEVDEDAGSKETTS